MYAIGIDLGTTNSCVAVREDGREEVLENDNGNLITPSCVTFTRGQTLIGEQAKHLLTEEPRNTICSIKRIIGRKFDDPKTQKDIKRWQFKVERSDSGRPMIKIPHHRETYNVEEISGLVLTYMRQIACKKLDEDVRDAVVTVPAYFNHMQRTAIKTAAQLAGLNILGIINEPTAAAISFGMVKKYSGDRNILVYDFGGGTFDVTVLSIRGTEFDVKASSGDRRLGGDDLTYRLVEDLVECVKTEMGLDVTSDDHAMNKLLEECEKAKKELTYRFEYRLLVENIANGKQLRKTINRSKFISINKDLLEKTMHYVKDTIKESGMEKEDIHFVVPVGGSSRIPFVVDKLGNYFGKDKVKMDRNPEQTIAKGAAVYAAYLNGSSVQQISEIHVSEVTPLSLSYKVISGKASVVIKRNTKIPVTQRTLGYNSSDYQEAVSFPICQGEEERFEDNEYLGTYNLEVTRKPKGEVKVEVKFRLDLNGILYAKSTEIGVGRSQSTEIDLCGTLAKLDVRKLKRKLEKLMSDEEEHETEQEEMYRLESTMSDLRTKMDKMRKYVKEKNPRATKSDLRRKKKELHDFL